MLLNCFFVAAFTCQAQRFRHRMRLIELIGSLLKLIPRGEVVLSIYIRNKGFISDMKQEKSSSLPVSIGGLLNCASPSARESVCAFYISTEDRLGGSKLK